MMKRGYLFSRQAGIDSARLARRSHASLSNDLDTEARACYLPPAISIHPSIVVIAALLIAGNAPRLFAGATTQPAGPDAPTASRLLLLDDDDDDTKPKPAGSAVANPASSRYFFGLLDNRSSYGKDFFPDAFLGPEFDAEQQLELDYLHGEKPGVQNDEVDAGVQWNVIGQLSVAAEFGWDSHHQDGPADTAASDGAEQDGGTGWESLDLAVYHPIFQYVTPDNLLDYTAVARLDVGIPTRTPASGNDVQLTPYLGHLLRLGDHISVEAWTGSQFTIAPHQTTQLIYGASFGYQISHNQFPVPSTQTIIPVFELDGQLPFSGNGEDALFGVAGINVNLNPIDEAQPTLQLGYQFPLDQGARDQLRWGILANVLFEF
jgi:hypothetical protein